MIIILAAGRGTRWAGAQPKQLSMINGEPLILRTLKQVNLKATIIVNAEDEHHFAPISPYLHVVPIEQGTESFKFSNSMGLWSSDKRTIILLGDVWFSSAGMMTILDHPQVGITLFGRKNPSLVTGCTHGEIWGLSFYPQHFPLMKEAISHTRSASASQGWQIYDWFMRTAYPLDFVEIDDWTEDFDTVEELDSWLKRRAVSNIKNLEDGATTVLPSSR